MDQSFEILNAGGASIGTIALDRASGCWWIAGSTERFRTDADAYAFWLANYDPHTGALLEPSPRPVPSPEVFASDPADLPSFLE